jgi:two-component system cell cycle sensor histidine kinase/response regulator CckA
MLESLQAVRRSPRTPPPSSVAARSPASDADGKAVRPARPRVVLLADDDPVVRQVVRLLIELQGDTVLEAEDGAHAVASAAAHDGPIDLLLTDVVMENMNGSTLAKTIIPERPETAVLYMSGYPDSSIASYGVLDPDVDLLQKPFTSGRLLKRVRRALDAHRRRRKMVAVALERR